MKEFSEIVLFDGVCNFCNNSVQFIIRHERKPDLVFASLQSETGRKLLEEYKVETGASGSLVYVRNGKAFTKTSGALRIAKKLKGLYPLLSVFLIFPPFLRDWLYNLIARNRYKWWGKSESCQIPSPALRKRFIDL